MLRNSRKFRAELTFTGCPVPLKHPITASESVNRARTTSSLFSACHLVVGKRCKMFDKRNSFVAGNRSLDQTSCSRATRGRFDARSKNLIARWRNPSIVLQHGMLPPIKFRTCWAEPNLVWPMPRSENLSKSAVFMALGLARLRGGESKQSPRSGRRFASPLRRRKSPQLTISILAKERALLKEWYRAHADWNVVARNISALLPAKSKPGRCHERRAVVIITPELSPAAGGVGDYTLRLLENWPNTIGTRILVAQADSISLPYQVARLGADRMSIRKRSAGNWRENFGAIQRLRF